MGRFDVLARLVVLADGAQSLLQELHLLEPAFDPAIVPNGRRDRCDLLDQSPERLRYADELLARLLELFFVDALPGAGHDPLVGAPVRFAERLDLRLVALSRLFLAVGERREREQRDGESGKCPQRSSHLPGAPRLKPGAARAGRPGAPDRRRLFAVAPAPRNGRIEVPGRNFIRTDELDRPAARRSIAPGDRERRRARQGGGAEARAARGGAEAFDLAARRAGCRVELEGRDEPAVGRVGPELERGLGDGGRGGPAVRHRCDLLLRSAGFLQGQSVWYGDLALFAFLYSAAIHLALCIGLVWTLRRVLPPLLTIAVAFAVASLPLLDQPLLVAALVSLGALREERQERTVNLVVVLGASFAAIEALIKLSTGPLIVALFLITLVGLRARWWQAVAFLALFVGEFLLFWLIAGQSLTGIPAFVANTREIVSGYSAAMPRMVDVPAWQVDVATIGAALLTAGLVGVSARAEYRDGRARLAGIGVMCLAAFVAYKEGVVRVDAGHLSLFLSTACALWAIVPWSAARRRWLLWGALAIGLLGIPARPPGPTNLDPIANVRYAADQVNALTSESRRIELMEAGRAAMKSIYRLDAATRFSLHGRSVAIEPWEAGVAWAYELDWKPLPVFQGYSAYTSRLDRLNAAELRSPTGPERILRENPALVYPEFPTRGLDNRFPGWDPPAQSRAILCHFVALGTTARWQVLGRTANRCGRPRLIASVEARAGAVVRVPAPARGEVVFVRIDGVEVAGLERFVSFALRAPARHLIVNRTRRYRLVPGTATDGLLLRGSEQVGGGGPFAQIPGARNVTVTGVSGARLSFFRMRVRSGRPPPPGG